jgi:hypothetical protein
MTGSELRLWALRRAETRPANATRHAEDSLVIEPGGMNDARTALLVLLCYAAYTTAAGALLTRAATSWNETQTQTATRLANIAEEKDRSRGARWTSSAPTSITCSPFTA